MREAEVEKQLKALQREIALSGEDVETLRRDQRAGMDALRLEIEALRRCLVRLDPDFEECFAAVRRTVMQETDPEALF